MKLTSNGITDINPKVNKRINNFYRVASSNDITLMNEMGFSVEEYVFNYKKALKLASKNNLASLKKATLLTNPKKYAKEDPQVLTDGALGGNSFYSNWLGFEGNDLSAVVDLDQKKDIKSISINFLQVTNHIVFFPEKVEFFYSEDNLNWKSLGKASNKFELSPKSKVNDIQTFSIDVKNLNTRYIKIIADNMSKAPIWHHGADLPSWIFADELIIE